MKRGGEISGGKFRGMSKAQVRLEHRIEGYKALVASSQTGGKEYTKPGSNKK